MHDFIIACYQDWRLNFYDDEDNLIKTVGTVQRPNGVTIWNANIVVLNQYSRWMGIYDYEMNMIASYNLTYQPIDAAVVDGNLVVSDSTNGVLKHYNTDMEVIKEEVLTYAPRALTSGVSGVVVSDPGTNNSLRYDREGNIVSVLPGIGTVRGISPKHRNFRSGDFITAGVNTFDGEDRAIGHHIVGYNVYGMVEGGE